MGGGGKGGGGGGQTPAFVREGTQDLANRSQQLFDLARPLLETGTGQIASLIRTGGPGANVPIISNAVAAQNSATQQTQREIGGDLRRAGLEGGAAGAAGTNFATRLRSQLQRGGNQAARNIPTRAAAPLITTAATTALGGTGAAAGGFQGALSALGTANRVGAQARAQAAAQRRASGLQLGRNLVGLANFGADQGFFDFLNRNQSSGVAAGSPAFQGFTPRPINGGLPF